MGDFWADLRELFGDGEMESVPGQAVRNLLADAEALLAVADWAEEAPHKYSTCTSASGKPLKCLCGKDDAFSALPEHLK